MKKLLLIFFISCLTTQMFAQAKSELGIFARKAIFNSSEDYLEYNNIKSLFIQYTVSANNRMSWSMGIGFDEFRDANLYHNSDIMICFVPDPFYYRTNPDHSNSFRSEKHLELQGGVQWKWKSFGRLDILSQANVSALFNMGYTPDRSPYSEHLNENPFSMALHVQSGLRYTIYKSIAIHLNLGANRFFSRSENRYFDKTRIYISTGIGYAW